MVKFEGTVNDKKFDNVDDYNAEVKRLVSAGIAFSASTRSYMEDEPEDNDEDVVNLFPHIINGQDTTFIDEGTKLTKEALNEHLANLMAPIVEVIGEMDEDDLRDYVCDMEDLGAFFESLKQRNAKALESVGDRLKTLEQQHRTCYEKLKELEQRIEKTAANRLHLTRAASVIEQWDTAYEAVYHTAYDRLDDMLNTEPEDQPEEAPVEENPTENLISGIEALWNAIFND